MEMRVLVVDDSALMRNLVSRIIESAPDLTVAGTAMNGVFALEKIPRLHPDVIVLDLEMPEMNGIEFLKARAERGIDIPVVILSSVALKGARITMEALDLGASDFITKPSGSVSHDIHVVGDQLIAMIRGYGGKYRRRKGESTPTPPVDYAIRTPRHSQDGRDVPAPEAPREEPPPKTASQPPQGEPKPAAAGPRRSPKTKPGPVELIVLGISTGGPNALRKLFAEIPADIEVPVVVVQHMPAGFTSEFAQSLNRVSPLDVKEAAEGDLLKAGRVLIAPGDFHIEVEKKTLAGIVHLNQQPVCNGHRPSAGILFRSAAEAYGNRVMGIIMTGMGRDGAFEIGDIYEAGGVTIGQDETSCVVYGMPRVADENGYLHRQASLEEMATVISETVKSLKVQQ
jgi:two-component system, chemotaxis family, protein-glutamate methylesterase/glutaminase